MLEVHVFLIVQKINIHRPCLSRQTGNYKVVVTSNLNHSALHFLFTTLLRHTRYKFPVLLFESAAYLVIQTYTSR